MKESPKTTVYCINMRKEDRAKPSILYTKFDLPREGVKIPS